MSICDVCGKPLEPYKRAHDCDGGEALRKAAHELFAPAVPLIEAILAKSGTGILRGVFEVVEERDELKRENQRLRSEVNKVPFQIDAIAAQLSDACRIMERASSWFDIQGVAREGEISAKAKSIRDDMRRWISTNKNAIPTL